MKNVYNKLSTFQKNYFLGGILMKIQLPKTFEYHDGPTHAVVHDGVLEMTPIDFEKTMYHLTYRLKGKVRCAYCHRVLDANRHTLDHVFPRDHGGISVKDVMKQRIIYFHGSIVACRIYLKKKKRRQKKNINLRTWKQEEEREF